MINAEAAETNRAEVAVKNRDRLNAISGQIVDAAMRVHTVLGPVFSRARAKCASLMSCGNGAARRNAISVARDLRWSAR